MQLKTDSACALRNSHPKQGKCQVWQGKEQTHCALGEDLPSQEPGFHMAHLCACLALAKSMVLREGEGK